MRNFSDAVHLIERELSGFAYEKLNESDSRAEYRAQILDENVNILLLTTSMTSSDRAKPQIRVFTPQILEKMNESLIKNEKFFCLIHCKHDETQLKFEHIKPYDYIVSLESDWNHVAGRIDIRSIYDYIEANPTKNYIKINISHNYKQNEGKWLHF